MTCMLYSFSMYFSRIWRVKEGKVEKFRDWMKLLSTSRQEEAIATFAYEHVTREVFVEFAGDDGRTYVIGLNEATEPPRHGDPNVPINQEHRAIKEECLEPITKAGEVLLDLKAK